MTREIIAKTGQVILVDDEDFGSMNEFVWSVSPRGYAQRKVVVESGKRITIPMHRAILGLPFGTRGKSSHFDGDHLNHNKLDNRKGNLRPATVAQNQQNVGIKSTNTSGFKGVTWNKGNRKWHARIRVEGARLHLGYYESPEEAHVAYCDAAKKHHGEFANFG